MLHVHSQLQPISMCRWDELPTGEGGMRFTSHAAVRGFLQVYKFSLPAMAQLREALQQFGGENSVLRADDDQVLDELASLIIGSRVMVFPLRETLPPQGGAVAPVPPVPPRPGPRPPGPRPPGPKPPGPTPPGPTPPGPKPPPVDPKGDLLVEIVDEKGQPITEEVEITASGPQALKQVTKTGSHTFKAVSIGVYSVSVKVPDKLFDKASDTQSSTAVPAGGQGQSKHVFTFLLNVVTPKLELEYKVVLLDRKLSTHQAGTETKIVADDVTYIEVSAKESTGAPKYTGDGTFEVSPANVEVFTDEACTKKLVGKVPNAQLFAGPVKLFLKSKTAGKFKAKLTLDPSTHARITVEPPVEEEMGVVELKLALFRFQASDFDGLKADPDLPPPAGKVYDPTVTPNDCASYHADVLAAYHKAMGELVVPAQVEMTDAQRIQGHGRDLSVLAGGHPSRARLLVRKLDATQWPAGTEDYLVQLGQINTSGEVAYFDKEFDGSEVSGDALSFKVSALTADKEMWVEGKTGTAAPADVQIQLSLDRAPGGLAKTPKKRGDVARATVAELESLAVDYTQGANEPLRWNDGESRWYINLAGTGVGALTERTARTVTLKAKLKQALAGVKLHVMIAPDPNNQKAANSGEDLPKGGTVSWTETTALTLAGPDAAKFEIRNKKELFLVDGILSAAKQSVYVVHVVATYSDGSHPISIFRAGITEGQDTTAGVRYKTFTTTDFPPTNEQLWKWDAIVRTVKHEDKAAKDAWFHLSAVTDAKGEASVKVVLSRFGGDVFQPACYIDQDVHLARYVDGHTTLGQRKPFPAAKKINVWRRAWLQKVAIEGIAMPDFAAACAQYQEVRADVIQDADLVVPRSTVDGFSPKAIYPRYMVKVNGGNADALVVSDTNKRQFFTTFAAKPAQPNMIPVLVCDAQWDAGVNNGGTVKNNSDPVSTPATVTASFPVDVSVGAEVLDPPLQPGTTLFVSGTWRHQIFDPAANSGAGAWADANGTPAQGNATGNLVAADLDINPARDSLQKVRVKLPAGVAGKAGANSRVVIENLIVRIASSFLGESFDKKVLAVFDPTEPVDFQNTVAHEVGHAYYQVTYPTTPTARGRAVPVPGQTNPLKIPPHPVQADRGQGNHCRHLKNMCVMFDSGPTPGSLNRYCKVCHPYLVLQDMSTIK